MSLRCQLSLVNASSRNLSQKEQNSHDPNKFNEFAMTLNFVRK